jgi:hypothetical protein
MLRAGGLLFDLTPGSPEVMEPMDFWFANETFRVWFNFSGREGEISNKNSFWTINDLPI